MKHSKRIASAAVALLLSLALLTPTAATTRLDIDLVREQYNWGAMFAGGGNEGSFVVWHGGEIVYQRHARGHGLHVRQPLYSVTKSVVATLTGIALHRGYLTSVQQRVVDFFPEAVIAPGQESKNDLTIEHLLFMMSGMPGMEDNSSYRSLFSTRDSGLRALMTPQADAPGQTFRYCSGTTPQLLVAVLQRATGQNLLCFAQRYLFRPLGMTSVRWSSTWDGSPMGGLGIHMSPCDMLRFGQLHLQNGLWEGQRIFSANWVHQMRPRVRPQLDAFMPEESQELENFSLYYGYMWWGGQNDLGTFFSAMGLGGNIISVYPALDLVVVRTGSQDRMLRVFTWGVTNVSRVFPIFPLLAF